MNYLSHGHEFCEHPFLLAGTAVPDWLGVLDRGVRVRPDLVTPWCDAADGRVASIAKGMRQHLEDDRWFHATPRFLELCEEFTLLIRSTTSPEDRVRASFVAHVLIEMLLDAALVEEDPALLDRYYAALSMVEAEELEGHVRTIIGQPVSGLARFVRIFNSARFLEDYAEDALVVGRMNQVLARVELAPLGVGVLPVLPEMRARVATEVSSLLPRRMLKVNVE